MTPLSRPRGSRSTPPGGNPCKGAPPRRWHIACIPFLASGCFYLGPTPTLEENVPPDVVQALPNPDDADALLIGPSGQAVIVLARDEEGDPITFTWTLSRDGYLGTARPVNDGGGSQVDLPHDPDLDGQRLTCLVQDDENDDVVKAEWLLEVW